ncbi:aminoacyl-tRNA hydrolase [Candidatus Pantoea edessiphila]|uniref:Peptidyl-tRNA hydrolase n=1 Tax=Candidatus Pantoea edessiphila TaxID=2044610 RepID=A0A2P5SYT3_9GAMM|nr:aminoacyl-tRNA hydrolase [Candidatus Pantoea edessiphila]MBK4775367.1 aminoacyl-tRNA hydrolase [Pantoea sp. Edef]PPI87501.1 aminoacyl-tRNA hydrolase [Candidatus Pantoea edessiphila]
MNRIKLIVGLLNPGEKYSFTRHNAGAWYINLLIKKYNLNIKKNLKFFGFTSNLCINNNKFHLLLPNTFINLSGIAVKTISKFYNILPEEILVAHDELDLPPGIIRFKFGGNHGGHNGLKDIISNFSNNKNFYRLRIGIGHPGNREKVNQFVLSHPSSYEKELINHAINEAVICTDLLFTSGYVKAINRLNSFKIK